MVAAQEGDDGPEGQREEALPWPERHAANGATGGEHRSGRGPIGERSEESYPVSWEADVVLRDGHTVRIRPISPEDRERLVRFHERQSQESIYFRYFSPRPRLSSAELRHFTHLDHHDRVAFVAILDDEVVGVARYERYRGTPTAEVAFFVDDMHQGRGLATLLLEFLVAAALHRGITHFTASALPSNRRMLAVFAAAGFDVSTELSDGVVHIDFDIHPTDESVRLSQRRLRDAEAASVRRLVRPATVAVIGVETEGDLGGVVLRNISHHRYRGRLLAVSPGVEVSGDVEAVASVADLPGDVDLAVLALPADQVPEAVEACGEQGVGAVVVLSAGFAERGLDGAALQWRLMEAARRHGIRVLGPNCLGLVNTDPEVQLNATIAEGVPPPGHVAVLSESGTLAAALVEHAERTHLGISTFVAAGNPLDVGAADLLSYWADDEDTHGVLLYLRSSGLPPRLVRAARAASMSKPVAALGSVLVGGGGVDRSKVRRRIEALTRQTGVIDVGTLEQLFDIGRILADQPVPIGAGVALVGNSDGAVAIAADACRGAGLDVLDPLRAPSSDAGSVLSNPVDLTMGATAEDYSKALAVAAADPRVSSVIVVHTPLFGQPSEDVAEVVLRASESAERLCFAAILLAVAESPRLVSATGHGVPVFRFPEHAARAIGRLADYSRWRSRIRYLGSTEPTGCDLEGAHRIVERALDARSATEAPEPQDVVAGSSDVELDLVEQEDLLACFGVDVAPRASAADLEDAVVLARQLGWPVVLKADLRDRSNRSAASGVVIDIADEADLRSSWDRVEAVLGAAMHPVVVQRFLERGVDACVVLRRLADGAATIEVGLGGPVSAFDEPALGVLPLSLGDAQNLVAGSALGRALSDPLDRVAIVGTVHRLAAMFDEVEDLRMVEADPIVAGTTGAWVADVRMVLRPTEAPLEVRRLA
jgi:acyl-CoA synthetase (NDP forming)/RimJ/RimL family protein N-acetyltransferase